MKDNLQKEDLLSPETEETPEPIETPETEEAPILPLHEQKVLGVSRFAFWGILFGYGGGLVLCGIVGMLAKIEIKNTLLFGIGGAAVGYFIGEYFTKKIAARYPAQDKDSNNS